jgi:hypothetical protein
LGGLLRRVKGLTAAGVDFDTAVDAAMTQMCDGCGCDWAENEGPTLPDDVWLSVNKSMDGLLCATCIEERLAVLAH